MANIIYLTVNGKKQGLISSGCSSKDSIGNIYQIGREDQIYVYELNHSLSRDQNVNHLPITIKKPIDKSTPLLGVAISNNEELDCTLDIYRTDENGGLSHYFTIKITGATISNIDIICPNSLTHNDSQPQEIISLKYKSITWQHRLAGTSGYSFWEDRIY
ncbi:Hcp family type VI secretion system effector [Xenorhabdus griffiniae]|uniref:Hcp family type VI secretion system effector n=1 Tax=Xenorhabdus griffiniae TaxID=351672 RepID=A0ABY9XF28_9GAMM|nr:Hcp family type VI secretion system effector [Xenorhabdus griffiniae]MBD1229533.1 Hcp family type VI secretion system effector [Xenorhabdus griffiniae]WMV71522.1 Hcp family type VI secretion system effector [Xenorhabdus griffiniae]WNH01199.1 Hcp family type VI secretion system effector [Xenorhabdus griffiniae]